MTDIYKNLPTGCCDEDGRELRCGDAVIFLERPGTIVFECGAFGIAFPEAFNWDEFTCALPLYCNSNGPIHACMNDNFISLWEIAWNLDAEENVLPGVVLETPGSNP